MKGFLLLIVVVGFGQIALAQTSSMPEVNLNRYNKLRKQQQVAPLLENRNQHQLPQGLQAKISQQKSVQLLLSHANALGEVYVLPQDNMPLLKPFFNGANPMPRTEVQQEEGNAIKVGKIPNVVPVQPFSFQQGKEQRK